MEKVNIVRAWKDAAYFASLSPEQQAMVPPNPAGDLAMTAGMEQVIGGRSGSTSARLAASCTNKTSTCCNCKPQVDSVE